MGFEIFIYILRWVTELIGKICDLPPAHPSSYFMISPLDSFVWNTNMAAMSFVELVPWE
jgi:hypothetical protein